MAAAVVIRFPPRRVRCVRLVRDPSGGWLVVARSHGWLFEDRSAALADVQWLSRNLDLPIRDEQQGPDHSGGKLP
jgi:hypothetical protein